MPTVHNNNEGNIKLRGKLDTPGWKWRWMETKLSPHRYQKLENVNFGNLFSTHTPKWQTYFGFFQL